MYLKNNNPKKKRKKKSLEFFGFASFLKRESFEMQNRMTKIQEKTQVGTVVGGQELNNQKMAL